MASYYQWVYVGEVGFHSNYVSGETVNAQVARYPVWFNLIVKVKSTCNRFSTL